MKTHWITNQRVLAWLAATWICSFLAFAYTLDAALSRSENLLALWIDKTIGNANHVVEVLLLISLLLFTITSLGLLYWIYVKATETPKD
ncbi:MAG: hypothetical protein H6824_21955 [Planctomycetaceae bacterium]|nr:hypothetical protein [Planctomycetaceae bacterium]